MIASPSQHRSTRNHHKPSLVVIHGDAGKSDRGTVAWITNPSSKVSYHYLIGRDGQVYQFVQESESAWHAGRSRWNGEEINGSVNSISVGVAFANDGQEPFRHEQYKEGAKLVAEICERWAIPLHRIRGHYEVSPGRKTDPWAHFNWRTFYQWFAFHAAGRDDMADWDGWADG